MSFLIIHKQTEQRIFWKKCCNQMGHKFRSLQKILKYGYAKDGQDDHLFLWKRGGVPQ